MDGADPSELARRDDLIRRQMAERTERQGWVHHVVDGDTGEVLTTPLVDRWRRSRAPSG